MFENKGGREEKQDKEAGSEKKREIRRNESRSKIEQKRNTDKENKE